MVCIVQGALYVGLVEAIRPHLPALRSSPYGKRILSRTSLKKWLTETMCPCWEFFGGNFGDWFVEEHTALYVVCYNMSSNLFVNFRHLVRFILSGVCKKKEYILYIYKGHIVVSLRSCSLLGQTICSKIVREYFTHWPILCWKEFSPSVSNIVMVSVFRWFDLWVQGIVCAWCFEVVWWEVILGFVTKYIRKHSNCKACLS